MRVPRLAVWGSLWPLAVSAAVQPNLSLPSSTTVAVTASVPALFLVPSSSSAYSLTLSLCSPPASLTLPASLSPSLYTSNTSLAPNPGPSTAFTLASALNNGRTNLTLSSTAGEGLWVAVYAPSVVGDSNGTWTFQLDVAAQGDDPTALDPTPGVRYDDSDRTTALLTSIAYSSPAAPAWSLVVAPTNDTTLALQASLCFVKSLAGENVTASVTTRGLGGATRTQFEVAGLVGATNYTAWLVNATAGAETLWTPVFFKTKTGDNCRLLHSLPFCPSVAHAVPTPPSLPTSLLIQFYNSTVQPSLAAFSRSLSTFPCDHKAMGSYSFVSGCSECADAFTAWACAVSMPRCTDASSTSVVNTTQATAWDLPATYQPTLLRDTPSVSRTPLLSPLLLSTTFPSFANSTASSLASTTAAGAASNLTTPFPYVEIPPCLNLCTLVAARCPPFLGWQCPTPGKGGTGTAGYGLTRDVPLGDRMGGEDLAGGTEDSRAGDRFGGVYCNALGSDLVDAVQWVSARDLD